MKHVNLQIYQLRRHVQRIGRAAVELVWPTRCACCEKLGALLCASCDEELPRIEQSLACSQCGAPLGKIVCTECTPVYEPQVFAFTQARCALEFTAATRRLILAYKDGNEHRLAALLAQLIVQAIPLEWRLWANVITWIPADPVALRRRGFDHMALVATALVGQMGLRVAPLLDKRSRSDQRTLNREERQRNMAELFAVIQAERDGREGNVAALLNNARIILIDDVFTTGATLDAATRVLREGGAKEVRVATIARVW